jgi:hypothetical protein
MDMNDIGSKITQQHAKPAMQRKVEIAGCRQFDDPGFLHLGFERVARHADQNILDAADGQPAKQPGDLPGTAVKMPAGLEMQNLHAKSTKKVSDTGLQGV